MLILLWFGIVFKTGGLQKRFWKSSTHQKWSIWSDALGVSFMFVFNAFFLVVTSMVPAGEIKKWVTIGTCAFIIAALAQSLWMKWHCDQYWRWRTYTLAANRLSRVAFILCFIIPARGDRNAVWLEGVEGLHQQMSSKYYFSHAVAYCRPLLLQSFAVSAMTHGFSVPLSFIPQTLLHLVYTVVLIIYHVPFLVAVPDLPAQAQFYKDMCYTMSLGAAIVRETFLDPSVNTYTDHQVCESDAKAVLLLFFIILVAFVLPVYFSYRLECCQKRDFLHRLLARQYRILRQHSRTSALQDTADRSEGRREDALPEEVRVVCREIYGVDVSNRDTAGLLAEVAEDMRYTKCTAYVSEYFALDSYILMFLAPLLVWALSVNLSDNVIPMLLTCRV